MSNKLKIIITSVICILIVGIGVLLVVGNNSFGEKRSKTFMKSIQYIQDENYVEAYNNIKNGKREEKELVQTIILYKFTDELDKYTEISDKLNEESEHITDYLTYTYLYSKNPIYQKNINKIYSDKYPELYEVKEKIPKDIMFEDTHKFYDTYIEILELTDGLYKNCEKKILNNNEEYVAQIKEVANKLLEYSEEVDVVAGKYPLSSIPEEYIILLELNEEDDLY